MNPRLDVVAHIPKNVTTKTQKGHWTSKHFGKDVFNQEEIRKRLPKEIWKHLEKAKQGLEKIRPEYADAIAVAIKEWAMERGATHYTHWFLPLTGLSAEKHDAFIDWDGSDQVLEKFSAKQLLQGEPDASSFPSGGLRSTYEARGYTGWDPTSPVFLWKGGDGVTLCIPSFFFSWTGDVLDAKIPLHRSDHLLAKQMLRLLNATGVKASQVFTTLGLEQEYFVVDRLLHNLRPDLTLLGKTVFGAHPPKGQELQDHYFGAVKDRILSYMHEFEERAIALGIPVKTRHNEVAPAQHEIAPVFERTTLAIDHNILLMEVMRQVASKHGLACLLHEKPFARYNGSGKHANWSIGTDSDFNLLDPANILGHEPCFIILLTAILEAVHEHSLLLRAAIGSYGNDYRLGGHEAPPAILSVYLGEELEELLEGILEKGKHERRKTKASYDFGIPTIPTLSKDHTDRNRTSAFAFTGNKFEFRSVGSSSNPSFAITCLNCAVAASLKRILDALETKLKGKKDLKAVWGAVLPILQESLKKSKAVRFSGDNYSEAWAKEAEKRGLPNVKKSIHAFKALLELKTTKIFEGVLNKQELKARYDIFVEHYNSLADMEAQLMVNLFETQVLPSSVETLKNLGKAIDHAGKALKGHIKNLSHQIDEALLANEKLKEAIQKAKKLEGEKRGFFYAEDLLKKAHLLRQRVDHLETLIEDKLWTLPKYWELLFLV